MQTESKFKANLVKIRSLRDGWFDGEGKALATDLLDWFEVWFLDLKEKYDLGGGYPSVFPDLDGSLELEWFLPRFQPTLSIEPDYQTAWFHFIDPDHPDGYYEIDIDLTNPADTEWLDKLKRTLAVGDS